MPVRRASVPHPDSRIASSNPNPKGPSYKRLLHRLRRILLNKIIIIITSIIVVLAVAGAVLYYYSSINNPQYKTVLPGGKSISELGGWTRVSPPDKDPVFAYTDKINNVSIGVSQQPLPQSFKTDTASHVTDLAKKYNATTEITTSDTVAYLGTSTKGPQSVIFTKKGLLILIKSQKKIDNAAWKDYIESLGGDGSGLIPKY